MVFIEASADLLLRNLNVALERKMVRKERDNSDIAASAPRIATWYWKLKSAS